MSGIDPDTNRILGWAKRAAVASGRAELTCWDLLCGVYASAEQESVARILGEVLGDPIRWPSDLLALYTLASGTDPIEDKLPLDPELKDVIDATFSEDRTLGPDRLLRNLLSRRGGPVAELVDAHTSGALIDKLEACFLRARELMAAAGEEVEGQGAAIAMLGDAFLRASLGASTRGPRGIFTFLGPPGVGKTLLAETFASHLAGVGDESYVFRRFDMSMFAGHQNYEQLFGTEGFYKGARAGTLTGLVHEHPEAVILFDEIEKAHDNVIQSLLAVLDKGEVIDKHLETPVRFDQTWLIFTSNLGREFFDESNQSGILHDLDHAPGMVFEILGSARRAQGETTAPALAPEFVSRLAKGGAVVFRSLETRHYMALLDRAIRRQIAEGRSRSGIDLPEVVLEPEVKLLFLLSLLPQLDARKVVSRSEAWSIDVIGRAYGALRERLAEVSPESFCVRVVASEAATAFLDARRPAEIRLLLIDEDTYLPPVLEAHISPEVVVHRVSQQAEVSEALRRFDPDMVLLDLTLGVPLDSAEVVPALRILEELRTSEAQLPVYLFSENPQERESFDQVLRAVLDRGGARGFIPCTRDPEAPSDLTDFTAQLSVVVAELASAKLLRRERRSHRTVSWDLSFRWSPDEGVVVAEVGVPRSVVAYSAADPGSPIQFRGIPDTRFGDVVGLERAKRRLKAVLDGLRDPSRLAAFSTTPPRGLLLAGPPGTGKTLMARALAGEAGLPFLALSAGELKSKWVGESEGRIRELFAKAREYAPAIVFIDEIDGLARARDASRVVHETSVLNQLLAELDGTHSRTHPGLVLAATNHPALLDAALIRPGRFDEIIPFDLPNLAARRDFFARRLSGVPTEGSVDLDRLARSSGGASPAELDRMVREAIYHATSEDRASITEADLHHARRLVRFGAEAKDKVLDEEDRRMTAYHEAGHALCFLLRFPERTIDHLTIVPNERGALGFLAPAHEEGRHGHTLGQIKGELIVALAGREAERLVAGRDGMTSGASSDLAHATGLAWHSICRWGFDEQIGPLGLNALPEAARIRWGELAATRLQVWLAEAASSAASDLSAHRQLLDKIATTLLERESLGWEDIEPLRP